jgi:hypothetical protein
VSIFIWILYRVYVFAVKKPFIPVSFAAQQSKYQKGRKRKAEKAVSIVVKLCAAMKETINQDILPLFQMRSGRKSWGKKEKERKMDIQTCRKKDDKKLYWKIM